MLFSVIVPTYNRPGPLAECLSALRRQTIGSANFEIIVVDDGSEPPAVCPAETEGPSLRLLRQSPRKGPAAARNLGAQASSGTYLAFTDDDCRPDAQWLAGLLRAIEAYPDELLGGSVHNGEAGNRFAGFNQALVSTLQEISAGTPNLFYSSNNLCLAAAHFHKSGGFDESFPEAAGEDRELCVRWQRGGGKLRWVPDAAVFHHHPQSPLAAFAMHYRYGKAARLLSTKQPAGPRISRSALFRLLVRRGYLGPLLVSQAAVACGYFGWPALTAASTIAALLLLAAWN